MPLGAALLQSLGVLVVSLADQQNRQAAPGGYPLFWLGLALIALPTVLVATSPGASKTNRYAAVLGLALALFLVRVVYDPLGFSWGDEFAHYRSALDLADSGRLFTFNPGIPVISRYPGLGLLTAGLSELSGLSITTSGFVVIGVGRLVLTAAMLVLIERITGSARAAALAVVIYAANPDFLYWDVQYAYESLALPLVVLVLALVTEKQGNTGSARWSAAAVVVIAALTVTHHVSSYYLVLLLGLWIVVALLRRRRPAPASLPWVEAGSATAMVAVWLAAVAPGTVDYLGPVFGRAAGQGWQLLTTGRTTRSLFAGASTGQAAPTWEHVAAVAATALLLVLTLWALPTIRTRGWPLPGVLLASSSLLWVVLLPLRFTQYGQETANRSTEFTYLGVGLAVSALLLGWLRRGHWSLRLASVVALCLVLVGGFAVSFNFDMRLAPPVSGARAPLVPTPDAEAAARWMLDTYGPGQRVATDYVTRGAFVSVGRQHTLSEVGDGAQLWRIFFPTSMTTGVYTEIRREKVDFIVVQQRLLEDRPLGDRVFDSNDPPADDARPLPAAALTKFDDAPGLIPVYRSGELRIYQVMHQPGGNLG